MTNALEKLQAINARLIREVQQQIAWLNCPPGRLVQLNPCLVQRERKLQTALKIDKDAN